MNKRKLVTLALIQTLSVAAIISASAASGIPAQAGATASKSFIKGDGLKDSIMFAKDLATVLGLDAADLKVRLDKGETPDAIIAASGKTKTDVMKQLDALRLASMKAKLQSEVASGTITQAQADARLTNMQNHTGGRHGHGKKSATTSAKNTTTSTQ